MPFKITTKGRIKLKRAGQLISEHTQETEAFESAIRHAEANGAGLYTVEPPVKELDVGVLSRVVFDPDTTPPAAPASVVATALSQTVIRITWAASTDTGGSGLAGYRVLRSTTSGGTYTQIGSDLSIASLSYDDAGLAAGSTHFYRIVAFDGRGNVSSQSSTASATTQASNPNTGLNWPAHSPGYVSLIPDVGGYGMQTVAGSGRHLATPATTVILVNSLASGNSGAALPGLGANVFGGTFEYAWRHSASPKVIIPIVSGWVQVQDSIPCQTGTPPRPGYVTYYGQAAPNPGLFLRGANVATNGASNLVAWHLRSYMGDDVAGLPAGNRDCFSSGYASGTTSSVVLINCELAWSVDEPADFNRSHSQITMVNCAVIEPLHRSTVVHPEDGPGVDHGFGPIIGSDTGNPVQTSSVSLFRNLFAHSTGRTPLISAQSYVHANNLHYNHGRPTIGQGNAVQIISAGATEANTANILGNAFVRGPNNDNNMFGVSVTGTYPAGSGAYSFANAQFGWTSPANQAGFFTSAPSGYVASSLQSAAFPGSWGSIAAVLQWAANPLSPTASEWSRYVDLMEGTVGAQPRWRTASIGRVKTVFNQIRDRLNGVTQSNQFVDTVTQAGGWFSVPNVTIDPLNPGTHWHAALPTGSDRDTPYTTGVFSDGKSRVGYTRLEAWAYEQHLYVMQGDLVSPTVPVNVTVTAQSTTTLRISWDASTDSGGSGLAGYRVYRSTTSGGTYTQIGGDLPASSVSFDDTSLSEATTRFYRVLAFDGNNNTSAQSAVASGTTQATGGGTGPTFFAVASGGSTSTSAGSQINPWSVEFALTRLNPGDTLRCVGAGPFAHAVGTWQGGPMNPSRSGTSTAPIIIMSHVPRQFVLNGSIYSDAGEQHRPAIGCLERNHVHYKDFTVRNGMVKMRGSFDFPSLYTGVLFEGIDVIGGDREGTDVSLKWGIAVQAYAGYTIRNNRVTMSNWASSYTGENSSAIACFASTDGLIEYNWADGTNVHAAYGQKAGACNRNTVRFNVACNGRSGDGGESGAGFYNKANTAYATEPSPCLDNVFYQNIIWNCFRAFQQNHGMWRTKIYNNTARNVDWFYRQWQVNNLDAELWNNICRGDGSTRFMEFEAGASNTLATYLEKSNHNCNYNAGGDHCFIGGTSISLAAFPASGLTTSVVGREANSISGNPLFVNDVDGGDFHLQAGSPCRNTGQGGVSMGAYITGTERIGPSW